MRTRIFGIGLLLSLGAAIVYPILDRDGSLTAKMRQGIEDFATRWEDPVPHVYDKTRNYYDAENKTYHYVGFVYDPEGNPVPDAVVYYFPSMHPYDESTRSDATGYYDLPRIDTGKGYCGMGMGIAAFAPGFAVFQETGWVEGVRRPIKLKPAGKISGRVIDQDGNPIANAVVTSSATVLNNTITNSAGEYLLENVSLDGYFGVSAKASGYGHGRYTAEIIPYGRQKLLDPTRTFDAPDIALEIADKVISGRVVDAFGLPVGDVQLLIHTSHLGGERVLSNVYGEFIFPHVLDEEYTVYVRDIDHSARMVTGETNLQVVGGETNIVAVLQPILYPYRP